jgi:MFS family permease
MSVPGRSRFPVRWRPHSGLTAGTADRTGGAARRLAPIAFINAVGNGLFFTISALYFTRMVGIGVAQLGIALTAGGICGALASIPVGHAAERWGPRRVTICVWLLEAAGMVAYTQVHSFAVFVPLVCAVVMLDRSAGSGYRVLLGQVLVGEERVRARSYLRALVNVGMGAGAATGALALELDSRTAYSVAILANAATFVVAAALLARLRPDTPPTTATAGSGAPSAQPRSLVYRDHPFLAVTVLSAVLTLQFGLLEIGMPLWVAQRTSAPHPTISAALVLNTALVALLQVRMSKGSDDLGRAARLCRRSGLLLAAGCLVFAVATGIPAWIAVVVVLAAAVLQTVAEVYFSVGTMALSYDLVPASGSGAYHGVFQMGYITAMLLAPVVITNTALRFGTWGWGILALLFALSGALMVPAGRWAARTRRAQPAAAAAAPAAGSADLSGVG